LQLIDYEKLLARVNTVLTEKCPPSQYLGYLKDYFKLRRTAASHIFVFMVSEERRLSKPYAVPVRFIPYRSLTDNQVKSWAQELISLMEEMEMKVVGKIHITILVPQYYDFKHDLTQ